MRKWPLYGILVLLLMGFGNASAQLWQLVVGGCSGDVRGFWADTGANLLYVVGSFHSAGGREVWSVATWDGIQWEPVGGGTGDTLNEFWSPPILTVVEFEQDIFVGGMMGFMEGDRSIRYLSRWDGTKWNACGNPTGNPYLEISNGQLFAMGGFDSLGGKPLRYLAAWQGNEWVGFGSPLLFPNGGIISCSEHYLNEYYFGGNFDHPDGYHEILRWDGAQWRPLDSGVAGGGWVNDITVYKGQLFVGGEFHSGDGNTASYLMAWDGNRWYDPFPEVQYTTQVKDLEIIDGKLYIVGNHAVWDGAQWHNLCNLAKYDGQEFCSFGGEYVWTTSIAGFQGDLYVSTGEVINSSGPDSLFPNGRDTVNFIAKWLGGDSVDICISQPVRVSDPEAAAAPITLHPNPATSRFTLALPATALCTLRIHSLTGQEVSQAITYHPGEAVDIAHLPAGLYFVEVTLGRHKQVLKLVKE